ncbi:MBL fold metallo-hydrolase [Kurthia sibirica]|uniref:Rhodanese domain-containing protein n=1 Tax=Kurthia sibirica TaxID=202750 RepID=A0A2U3AN92_9BACL|nr:MBL fold metallo-hydrolase [Kurthia sibirica]PWI25997.1 hypothetical protein DEX24_05555 [Kurthia sibirica]GEK35285.1 hypothetical protein KSI01_28180 [Kurthia sibirica]
MIQQWTAKKVASYAINKKSLLVLDVRNRDAFEDWKIEGLSFEYVNIPYFELLDGVEQLLPQLKQAQEVLVVCAKEGSSIMIAEMIAEEGLEVGYLVGGMQAWSNYISPKKIGDLQGGGELYQFIRFGKGCLSYMALSEGQAIVIDAARFTDVYKTFAQEKNVAITAVIDSHLHADHISGGRQLAQEVKATYYLSSKDATEVIFEYCNLDTQTAISFGQSSVHLQALYSPGHTIGSTSFIIDDRYLLTGDILFVDSIGRPDLAGLAEDWVSDLRETLYDRYRKLDEALIVLPAHYMTMAELNADGSVSKSLGQLVADNHGLNIKDTEEFRHLVTDHLPPQPNAYEEIRKVNMGIVTPQEEEQATMEIGPNRCAVR